MSIYAQQGYGKGTKIDRGFQEGCLDGVILSPQYETPDRLGSYVSNLRSNFGSGIIIAIDPQFYVGNIESDMEGHLPEYPYYVSQLSRHNFRSPRQIERYIEHTISYQYTLDLSFVVTPTVMFPSLDHYWNFIAQQLMEGSVEYNNNAPNKRPLHISIVFPESLFQSKDQTSDLLDQLTSYQVDGFYVIITSTNRPQVDPTILENMLYFTYVLSEMNDYLVVFGYTDLIGITLQAAGATATACGWWRRTQEFDLSNFRQRSGGRRPRPRYTSVPLLTSLLVHPEITSIHNIGLLNRILTRTSFDDSLASDPGNAPWSMDTRTLHHWQSLNNITNEIVSSGSIQERLSFLLDKIREAQRISRELENSIAFGTPLNHLQQWSEGIQNFCTHIGITIDG